MSRYAIKFPFRVRIHGGEFDESARAIHREDGLKTIQADSGIVLESTIERKQMSTKTTFKRIALVAVAALGVGVLPVSPANAGGAIADSIALSASTTTIAIGSTASTTLTQAGFLASAADSMTATVSLTSYPTGATATQITAGNTITLTSVDTSTATVPVNASVSGSNVTLGGVGATYGQLISGRTTVSVTPTLAGEYTYKITPGSTTYPSTATALTWTVTVTAKAKATAASVGNTAGSTLVYGYAYGYWDGTVNRNAAGELWGNGENDFTAATTTTLATAGGASCYTDLGKGAGCLLGKIVLSNGATAAGAGLLAAEAPNLTYVVSGPGSVSLYNASTNSYSTPSRVAYETTGIDIGNPGSLTKIFVLNTDGTPGKITVTISSGTTVIATVSATAFGNAKTITPTLVHNPILANATKTGVITAVVKDETGALVRGANVYAVSSAATVISNTYTLCGTTTSVGAVSCDLAALAAGTSNITLTTNSSATATTGVSSDPVQVRVSDGIVTKVDYAFGKESYAPGEAAVITATVSNAAGIMPAGTYTPLTVAVTGNYTLSNGPTTQVTASLNTGAATYNVTIPVGISGELTLTGTPATGVTATFGKTLVVNAALDAANAAEDAAIEAGDNANNAKDAADQALEAADRAELAAIEAGELAVAAAEEAGLIAQDALEAANEATDAALAAGEAAADATAAAVEAKDSADAATAAVAALATQVSALMAALNAKITTLSNLVAKIAKKVKA
jgi:trimeric autotransporter adhesin